MEFYKSKIIELFHICLKKIKHLDSSQAIMLLMLLFVGTLNIAKNKFAELPENSFEEETKVASNSPTLELSSKNYRIRKDKFFPKNEKVITVKIKNGDTLYHILKKLDITGDSIHKILSLNKKNQKLTHLVPGKEIKIVLEKENEKNNLKRLTYQYQKQKSIVLKRLNKDFKINIVETPTETKLIYKEGTINQSLFKTAKEIGLEDKVIMDLTKIFGWNIDFALDIRKDDEIKVLYEEVYSDGKKIETGNILAAEFVNKGKTHKAIRYTIPGKSAQYYAPDGSSLESTFVRTPVKFTRISSHFNLKRKHPVLHKIRAHKGIDYAAPKGTPVTATGDGIVKFIGNKGGYGKVIILKHGSQYTTLYAHLSKFAKLKYRSKVKKGQVIGYVGATGLASGNHLHYEFRINGVHRNPLTVALPKAPSISKDHKQYFNLHKNKVLNKMETLASNFKQEKLIMLSNLK